MLRSALKRLLWFVLRPVVRRSGPGDRVYLTFDDGPHPVGTPRLLDALQAAGVQATFFMTCDMMDRHPELVRRVRDMGHAIGLHGCFHDHLHELSLRAQLDDLRQMAQAAQRFGLPFRLYRPPYGELSVLRVLWCLLHRVRIVMWTLDSGDSYVPDGKALEARSEHWQLRGGDVVLFHDDTAATFDSMPVLLERFKQARLELASLEAA